MITFIILLITFLIYRYTVRKPAVKAKKGILLIFIILLILLVLFLFPEFMAKIQAKHQKYFLVLHTSSELVVLRNYSGKLICAVFNREKKEIGNKLYIKLIEEIAREKVSISLEEVGPLLMVEK